MKKTILNEQEKIAYREDLRSRWIRLLLYNGVVPYNMPYFNVRTMSDTRF